MKKSHRQSMPIERGSSHPALLLLVAAAVTIATPADIVKADVLYDRTDMTDNQTYNDHHSSFIGGFAQTGQLWDVQTADDFELDDSYVITTIVADFINISPKGIPADGFLVEFFPNETENCLKGPGPCPSEIPVAQAFAASFDEMPFEDTVFNSLGGHRFTIDVSAAGIVLEPGTWWISVVAVDETEFGLKYRLLLTTGMDDGRAIHRRSGGVDHGNGYPGGDLDEWHPTPVSAPPGDAAIRIEGTLVQPVCPWDIDGSNDVGVKDLLFLLGTWGPCPPKGDCPADFDTSGDVGVKDLLMLLGAWGMCP